MFSIFHRVTGIILALFLLSQPIFIRATTFHFHDSLFYGLLFGFVSQWFWFLVGIVSIVLLAFHYHTVNGIRHIIWDINATTPLNLDRVVASTRWILILAFFLLSINILRVIFS